jgi:hypothetical protein
MNTIVLLQLFLIISISAKAQEINLKELLIKAEKAVTQYTLTFKNLSADELKTFVYYKNDGKIDETRIIKSNFIVYQSPRTNMIDEYRNPLEFNGKNVSLTDEKIFDFFEKLAKSNSDLKEHEKLRSEGNRYDGKFRSWGMTLLQITPFFRLMPFYDFSIIGFETISGRKVFKIKYLQNKPTLFYKVNPTNDELIREPNGWRFDTVISEDFRPTNPNMNGEIWLDAESGQIWKNSFKIEIKPDKLSKPVLISEYSYEYQPSKYGIMIPKIFQTVSYRIQGKNDDTLKATKIADRKFEYSNFIHIGSEIKKYEVGK